MTAYLPFEEVRLIVLVPADREEVACQATQRVLESQPFRSAICRAIRQFVRPISGSQQGAGPHLQFTGPKTVPSS
jgi:hypothetical protein